MAVKIQLYGQLKQITGASEIITDAADTDGLMKEVATRFPLLENLTCLIAVDRNIVQANTTIKAGSGTGPAATLFRRIDEPENKKHICYGCYITSFYRGENRCAPI